MTEHYITGRIYRILTDATNDVWDRLSFWKRAKDVEFNDGSNLENNRPNAMLRRNTLYSKGTVAYISTAPTWVMLMCTTAGTTANIIPTTYSTISSVGTVITDGTAKFVACERFPNTTISSSEYKTPALAVVNDFYSRLSANGKQFYFDYQNGKYGYNTDANRGQNTFVAF